MNAPGRGAYRALAGLLLPLAIAFVGIAAGSVAPAHANPSGAAISPHQASQARAYWTAARMARARPLEIEPRAESSPAAAGGVAARGAPLRVAARAPSSTTPAASAGRPPFEEVIDPTAPESRVNGVIFFGAFGFLDRCSGTAVNAPNLSVVITAAHCVNSGGPRGRWYRHGWVFVPGYRYGQRPFGIFPAKWLDVTPRWLAERSENADVAAAVVMRNERGQRLGAAVGGAGFASGLSPRQVFDVHGYPAGPPFNGETQRVCAQTPFLGHDPQSILMGGGPLNLAVACNVTGGASGGGWTIADGLLNSVTNYGYTNDAATDFGSYFGKEVARLYHRAGSVK
jgi:hypothetical protein